MKIIYIVLVLLVTSCRGDKIYFSNDKIKEYAKGDFKLPSVYGSLNMFVLLTNNKVGSTNINLLHTMYVNDYSGSYTQFEEFVFEALNQKITFPENLFVKRNGIAFMPDNNIAKEYEDFGLPYLLNKYCDSTSKDVYIKGQFANSDTLLTILYYFFINDYQITNDDYIGRYYLVKASAP